MSEKKATRRLWEAVYDIVGGTIGVTASAAGRLLGRETLMERSGQVEAVPPGVRPLWFHGASVGELVTLRPLIAEVRDRLPGVQWGITTTTIAGREGARAQYPEALFRRLLPLDAWPATPRFLDRIRPGAMIIVETELWPRLLLSLARRHVPVCLASARLTGRSVARYRKVAGLFADVVRSLDLIAARSDADRDRFLALGADPERTVVMGNTKLDALAGADPSRARLEVESRLSRLCAQCNLVVWGCLRPGEEELAIGAIRSLTERTRAFFVLAPRHLPEFDRTAAALEHAHVPYIRWSESGRADDSGAPVLLLDTIGLLREFYARADVAVVGGTFGSFGGHNLMEPAMFGVPVIFGPDTTSWPDDAERLLDSGGGFRVHGPNDLAAALWEMLNAPEKRTSAGKAAREAAEAGRGASRRIVDALTARRFFDGVTRAAGASPK